MMKKKIQLLISILLVCLSVGLFFSCERRDQVNQSNTPDSSGNNPESVVLHSIPDKADSANVSNLYDQYLRQYRMRPDQRILSAFKQTIELYNQYLVLSGRDAGFSMENPVWSSDQVEITILKNKKPLKTVHYPVNMSFQQAMEGLSQCLDVMSQGKGYLKQPSSHTYGSYESGQYQAGLNSIYEMDPRKIINGLLDLEELIRSVGPDPKLMLTAVRGYVFLSLTLIPDQMGYSSGFTARAWALLTLASHLAPNLDTSREQCLVASSLGYKAHALKLIKSMPAASKLDVKDKIIDAYLEKDFIGLNRLRKDDPGAIGHYFLTRLYRESGLYVEARLHAKELLTRTMDHYPAVVEMIYSADLNDAKILTILYPLHILLSMEYKIGSQGWNDLKSIKAQFKTFLGKSPTGRNTSFADFEALLSQWQPLSQRDDAGFLINAEQIKTIYRTLFSGAVSLRHHVLVNRWNSLEHAQNYVKAMSMGNENYPLAMSMSADVAAELGDFNSAKVLCKKIVRHPDTSAYLAMKALYCIENFQFKFKLAPDVFRKLDAGPANLIRMGNLFTKLFNYDRASDCYVLSLQKDPFAFSVYPALADIRGDSEPIDKVLETFGYNFSFLENAGDYYKKFNDADLKRKALDCYNRALAQSPSRKQLYTKKASLLKDLGEYEKARETLSKWLAAYGSNDLSTTIVRGQLANLLLKMELPEQALEILKDDLGSYQAGVMMVLASIYEAMDQKSKSWEIYEKAVKRYPGTDHVLSGTAAFLWRNNEYDKAAAYISKGRQRLPEYSQWYFDDYMKIFSTASKKEILASYQALVETGARDWERSSLAYRFEKAKRPEIAYIIMSRIPAAGRMQELERKIDQYKILKNWKGEDTALQILTPYLNPQIFGPMSMVLFKEGMFDLLLTHIKTPDDYPENEREFMWLTKLMAWLATDKPAGCQTELEQHYQTVGDNYYQSIGAFLMEKITLQDLLSLIKTPKQRCEFAYYIGYSYRMKGDFRNAADWYQICLETGLVNNGEYHWASDELFWWAHMGTKNRHKNIAQDILAYKTK